MIQKNFLFIVCVLLFVGFVIPVHSYGQKPIAGIEDSTQYPKIVRIAPDNKPLVIMTLYQAKKIDIAMEKNKELQLRFINLNLALDTCSESNKVYETRVNNLKQVIKNDSTMLVATAQQRDIYKNSLARSEKEIKRQKVQKWVAIISAGAIAILAILL